MTVTLGPTPDDIAEVVQRYSAGHTYTVVRFFLLAGYTVAEAHEFLLAAYHAGRIELRPESGWHLIGDLEASLCPRGPQDSVLSGIRALPPSGGE